MADNLTRIEYRCSHCGTTTVRAKVFGKPEPGYCMRRKNPNGSFKPHVWVKNRTF